MTRSMSDRSAAGIYWTLVCRTHVGAGLHFSVGLAHTFGSAPTASATHRDVNSYRQAFLDTFGGI
jgi:hypothetical protein